MRPVSRPPRAGSPLALLPPLTRRCRNVPAPDASPPFNRLPQSDATLVDIRSAAQVESKGVPGLPRGSQNKLVNVEFDEISVSDSTPTPTYM